MTIIVINIMILFMAQLFYYWFPKCNEVIWSLLSLLEV